MVLLLLAALTAASETSIIAVSRLKLKRRASGGSKAAAIILKILETPERFFGTILVANNIVDILMASIVTAMMIALVGDATKGVLFATIIVTFLIIVSEVAAKTFAARHSERLALVLARPVKALIAVFSPVVKVLAVITNAIVNLFGGMKGKQALITEEEIRSLIKIGEEEDVIHKEKYKMLTRVFDFSDAVVRKVMRPRKEIVAIDIDASFDDIVNKVLESGYSRVPVYRANLDNIIGLINMKDLLNLTVNKGLVVLQDMVYPATFVSGTKKVTELLKSFQKGHTHLAIVTDESGKKVEGLVTLEDLLEEIVGEIEDEHDVRAS